VQPEAAAQPAAAAPADEPSGPTKVVVVEAADEPLPAAPDADPLAEPPPG
jgi:hypothetical protein